MKKLFLFLTTVLCSLALLYSCSSDDEPEKVFTISLDKEEMAFDSGSDLLTVTVTSNDNWTVSGTTDWCSVLPTSGKEGDTEVSISVTENTTSEDRSCTLTFHCGETTKALKVLQYAPLNTHYVDMKFDDTENVSITSYDEKSGEIKVCYTKSSMMPQPEVNEVIVMPYSDEYPSMIRIIEAVSISGNTITLQTRAGTMSNLFENVEFVLTTDPSISVEDMPATRSGKPIRVITPQKMFVEEEDGTEMILFDRTQHNVTNTRNENVYPTWEHTFNWGDDFSNETLLSNSFGTLSWEKCAFGLDLNVFARFFYGDNYLSSDNLWGLIFWISPEAYIDLLLKYSIKAEGGIQFDKRIKDFPPLKAKFMVGSVPVFVDLVVSLNSYIDISAEAELTATAGFNYRYPIGNFGVNWYNGSAPIAICNFGSPSYSLYPPTLNLQGSLNVWGGFYPQFYVKFEKLAGPWCSLLPYLNLDVEAGLQETMSGEDEYMGWKAKFGAGLAYNVGLDWAFRRPDQEPWALEEKPIKIEETYQALFNAPYSIELVSPESNTQCTIGTPVEVKFRVASHSPLTPTEDYNCPGAVICFESASGGDLNEEFVITDEDGVGTVIWTPGDVKDKLTAKIVDKEGEEIESAEFSPAIADYELTLTSHQDGDLVESGTPVNVTFQVKNKNADESITPASGVEVKFSSEETATSDTEGYVTTEWTPTTENPKLTAYIEVATIDAKGNPTTKRLVATTFSPTVITSEISLSSPEDGAVLELNKSVNVSFLVQYKTMDNQTFPYSGRTVTFTGGGTFQPTATANSSGIVTVQWTPTEVTDILTANVVSPTEAIISSATFTPVYKINTVRLVSPENGTTLEEDKEVTVTFQAYEASANVPLPGEAITFTQTGTGTLSATTATSNEQGEVSVTWKPSKGATLTAKLEQNGQTATFTPVFPEPSLVGKWNCISYKEGVGAWMQIPAGYSQVVTFGENGGAWSIVYTDTVDPEESYSYSGIKWRVNSSDNALYLTDESGTEFAYTYIDSLSDTTLVIRAPEEEDEPTSYFKFERVVEEESETRNLMQSATSSAIINRTARPKFTIIKNK